MAGPKYDVNDVKAKWLANGKDFAATMAAIPGISRASLYRLIGEIKAAEPALANGTTHAAPAPQNGGVAVAEAPAAVLPAAALEVAEPQVPHQPAATAKPAPAPAPTGGARIARDERGVLDVALVTDGPIDLSPYIPAKTAEIVGYKPRGETFDALKSFETVGKPTLVVGEAGTGKTSSARYLAHILSRPFLEVSCDALLGFQELFGSVNITGGTSHFIEGLFLKFIQVPSVILLDEVNALDPAKNFKLHQLLQTREIFIKEADRGRGKLYKVHDNCFIVLAGNPPSGKYNGVNRWNVALMDRVNVIKFDEFTQQELDEIVPAHAEKAKLLKFYHEARQVIARESLRTTFSVRSIKDIIGNLNMGFSMRNALLFAFLNKVEQTAGAEAYGALFKLANAIWDISDRKARA